MNYFRLLFALIFLSSCSNAKITNDPSVAKYIANSDTFDIKIAKIQYDTVHNVYYISGTEGNTAKYIGGLKPKITYSITNSSGNEVCIPIPGYYYITTDFFDSTTKDVAYDKTCRCYVGDKLAEARFVNGPSVESKHDTVIGDNYALKFKSGETKAFQVIFPFNFFPENAETFIFSSFSYKEIRTGKNVDIGFLIDVANKKVLKQLIIKQK